MFLSQNLFEALESLVSNKLRAGLTMLGIVIGVAAVVAMLAVGQGASAQITSSITSMGTNLIFITSGGGQGTQQVSVMRPLTLEDAEAIADSANVPDAVQVAPILEDQTTVTGDGQSTNTMVLGVTSNYQELNNSTLSEGDFISDLQVKSRASVVVLGTGVAEELFGTTSGLVGQTVRIGGQPFRVIGVQASKGGTGFGSADDRIFIPLTTAQSRVMSRQGSAVDQVQQIMVQASSSKVVPQAVSEITTLLEQRHHVTSGKDDFTITKQQDILQTANQVTGVLTIFLGGIAGISLLVGGIGIMNIMLVSVTERTREIGLRKALGARRRELLVQFLTESAGLSLGGGAAGILVGALLAWVIGRVAASSSYSFTPVVTGTSVLLATLFSAAVGVFFGIYPASRAASLQPVEALRHE